MLKKEELDLARIKAVTEAGGTSGNEFRVTRLMKSALEGYAEEFDYDNLGSLICLKKGKGNGPRVMVSSHTDEIGFIVQKIEESGLIRVMSLNRWWTHTLLGQEVLIHTSSGKDVPGLFGVHFPDEDKNPDRIREMSELYIDTGVRGRENVLELGIQRGDSVTIRVDFREMADPDVMMAKAWDDRIGVNIIIDVMKQLKGHEHESDVFVCGTVQEEVGYRGGKTAGYKVKPDISITVDVAKCDDFPGSDPDGHKLKGGVVIRHYDSKIIGNRELSKFIQEAGRDLGYPVDIIVQNYGGGEAHEIHRLFDGIVTISLSIPSLYILSPRAFVHKDRYIATVNTLVEVIKRLTNDDLQRFKESNR
ncbi:M42 family metallopeptidase [Sporosarcina sp. SAFN-015]|uniref:M42 family metallopeptidase n=1 Tax=Sporosarcina sp. SAFN-015 TaxID=3387274 RepID=UPI003F7FD267